MKKRKIHILISIFFCTILIGRTQTLQNPFSVEFNGTNIGIEESFGVSVVYSGLEASPVIVFPNLKNFERRETSKSVQNHKVDDEIIIQHVVTQHYYPLKKGVYQTGVIEINVNNQILRSEGITIVVRSDEEDVDIEQVLPQLDDEFMKGAFLAVTTTKQEVYVQEGFNLKLSLLIADDNTLEMDFYEPQKQLEAILKQIKPSNCWEENFEIREIVASPIPIYVNGKKFTEYRIYQASFFPLNNQSIRIPAIKWLMQVTHQGTTKKTEIKSFSSNPLAINVKPLPPHPLKGQVMVGIFMLEEKISSSVMRTGNSYQYEFKIIGEGNLQAIKEPIFANNTLFDVYAPEVEERPLHKNSKILGSKSFKYQLMPRLNGVFNLKNLIYWVYFDPIRAKYDTLHSQVQLKIEGENITYHRQETNEAMSLYKGIENWDSTLRVINYKLIVRYIANLSILAMLMGMFIIIRKK